MEPQKTQKRAAGSTSLLAVHMAEESSEVKGLFVGNIDRSVDRRELEDFFADEGFKISKLGTSTPQCLAPHTLLDLKAGFAFVFLENADEAVRALDGKELARRPLKVEFARGDGSIKRYLIA